MSLVVEVSADQLKAAPKPSAAVPVEFTPRRATVTIEFVAALLGKTVKLPVTVAVDGAIKSEPESLSPNPAVPLPTRKTPAAARLIAKSGVVSPLVADDVQETSAPEAISAPLAETLIAAVQ